MTWIWSSASPSASPCWRRAPCWRKAPRPRFNATRQCARPIWGRRRMLLRLEGLGAGWGEARILHDITLDIAEGEAVALLGRNGAGKTTLISALMGVARQ